MNPFCLFASFLSSTPLSTQPFVIRYTFGSCIRVATIKSRVHLNISTIHILHIKWMFGMLNQWQLCLHAISTYFYMDSVFFFFCSLEMRFLFAFIFVLWFRSTYKQLEAFRSEKKELLFTHNSHRLRAIFIRLAWILRHPENL